MLRSARIVVIMSGDKYPYQPSKKGEVSECCQIRVQKTARIVVIIPHPGRLLAERILSSRARPTSVRVARRNGRDWCSESLGCAPVQTWREFDPRLQCINSQEVLVFLGVLDKTYRWANRRQPFGGPAVWNLWRVFAASDVPA